MHYIALRIAKLLAKNSDYQFNEDEIRYGLEVSLGAVLQIIIILALAFILDIGNEVFVILASAGILRGYSGGGHCKAYYRCTICSIFTFITLGYLVHFMKPGNFLIYFILALVFSFTIVIKNAPVDNPVNPIIDMDKRQKLKKHSIVVLVILLILAAITEYFSYSLIAVSILTGMVWQVFTLTNWGHMFTNAWDQAFTFIERTFQRKEGYNNEQI